MTSIFKFFALSIVVLACLPACVASSEDDGVDGTGAATKGDGKSASVNAPDTSADYAATPLLANQSIRMWTIDGSADKVLWVSRDGAFTVRFTDPETARVTIWNGSFAATSAKVSLRITNDGGDPRSASSEYQGDWQMSASAGSLRLSRTDGSQSLALSAP